jgi:hypothetical protein
MLSPKYLLESHTDKLCTGEECGWWQQQNWGSNKTTALETVSIMINHTNVDTTNPVVINVISMKGVMPANNLLNLGNRVS